MTRRPRMLVEALEPRILYSADAAVLLGLSGALDGAQVRVVEPAAAPASTSVQTVEQAPLRHEIVFVDSRVPDPMRLVDTLAQQRGTGRSLEVVMLDADHDGMEQIGKVLAGEQGLAAIHIISHGSAGAIEIGSTRLDAAMLAGNRSALSAWGNALRPDGDLLLYGCEVAQGAAGQAFVQELARLTGADVAASIDATGHVLLGGDWELEVVAGGPVDTGAAVGEALRSQWVGLLPTHEASTVHTGEREIKSNANQGQTFEHNSGAGTYTINQISVAMRRDADAASQTITVTLRDSWNGSILGSAAVSSDSFGTSLAFVDLDIGSVTLNDNQAYTIRVTSDTMDGKVYTGVDPSGGYAGGTRLDATGSSVAGEDVAFKAGFNTNTAPVLDTGMSPALNAVAEDAAAPSGAVGTLVSALVDFASPSGQIDNVSDADGGALLGIAVTAADSANGTWWYSTNNGSDWNALAGVSGSAARLLAADANTSIYFRPNADYNGTLASAITFRAWDQSSGSNGGTADTTASGSPGAFSTATDTASLTVSAVNDAPVASATGSALAYIENAAATVIDPAFVAGDVDSASLTGATVTVSANYANGQDVLAFTDQLGITGNWNTGTGVLTLSGSATQADYQTALRAVTYANTSDDPSLLIRSVSFVVSDGTDSSTAATRNITLAAIDDAPIVTSDGGGAAASVSVAENAFTVTTVTSSDIDGAAPAYSIVGGLDAALFTIDATTGALGFAAAPDYEAPADADSDNVYDVMVQVSDGSLTDSQSIAVTVTGVNDNAPVVTSNGGAASAAINVAENSTAVTTVIASDADAGGALTYSISGGADAARFAIDAGSGALSFVMAPDFEAPADAGANNIYDVTVQVSDGTFADTQTIAVTVIAANDNAPTITSNGGGATALVSIAENNTAATTLTASDADLPAQTLTYSIAGGADAARFTINSASGALGFVAAPNFESPTDAGADNVYDVTVRVSDGTFNDTQAIAVTVTDANDAPVITSNGGGASASLSMAENTTAVTTVSAGDADVPAQTLTYSIVGGADAARFTIDAATGALSFAAAPDHESPADANSDNIYDVTVSVSDGTLSDSQAIAVTVSAANDNVPVITSNGGGATASVSVAENGAVVTIVMASDADLPAQTLTYSIAGGADAALFTVNAATGALAFVAAPDYEAPADADADNVYDVTVQVSDGSLTDSQAIAVTVTAVNDNAPVVTSNGGAGAAAVNVAENTTAVTTVIATDADAPSQTLTYSIAGGADAARFTIDAATGALGFIAAPDYEAPADAGSDNVYDVTVQVSDGSLTDSQSIAVTVTAINDNAPVIASNGGGATASVSLGENNTAVTTLSGSDADLPAQTLTYSIVAGADAARFSIDSASGALRFVVAPDYEAPADANADNVYDVTVQVSDGALTDSQAIAVTVTAVNDNAPVITSNGGGAGAALNVAENSAAVMTVTATDADAPAQTLSYSIVLPGSGGAVDGAMFSVDANTGVLSFQGTPDFEAPADVGANNVYDVTVRVSDGNGGTDVQVIAITVTDTEEFDVGTPVDGDGAANAVAENGAIGTVVGVTGLASDADATTNTVSYSLSNNPGGLFAIDTHTGVVTTAAILDREALGASVTIEVTATSADTSTAAQTFSIAIDDVDEFDVGAVTDSNATANAVAENVAAGTVVGITASAFDSDATTNAVTYSLSSNPGGLFAIDAVAGVVTTAVAIDREALGGSVNIEVTATSVDGSVTTQTFSIAINDFNEFAVSTPVDSNAAANAVAENAAVGTVVGITANAFDRDATGSVVTYSLTGNPGGLFTIDAITGVVTTAAAIDREALGASVTIEVIAMSADTSTAVQTFGIAINDLDEFDVGALTDSDGAVNTVAENAAVGTVVGVTAFASDADPTSTVTYSLSGNPGGLFAIDAATGVVTVGAAIDREALGASVSIEVTATSVDGSSAAQAFSIAINDVNEAPGGSDATLTTAEDTAYAFAAADFGFVDPDAGDTLSSVRIDSLPSAGTLRLAGAAIEPGQHIASTQLGSLVFTPATDGNGSGYADFTFSTGDGAGVFASTPRTITIDVTPVNDAPELITASLSLLPGQSLVLGAEQLRASDVDDPAASLTLLVSNMAHGRFESVANPGTAISQFTQADVTQGKVRFVPAGITQVPTFDVTVSDANLRSAVVSVVVRFSGQAVQQPTPAEPVSPVAAEVPAGPAIDSPGGSDASPGDGHEGSSAVRIPVEANPAESSSSALLLTRADGVGAYVQTPLAPPTPAALGAPQHEARAAQEAKPSFGLDFSLGITPQEYLLRIAFAPDDDALLQRTGLRSGALTPLVRTGVDAQDDAVSSPLVSVELAQAAGIALTAGTVGWALRVGGLLTSLLGALPAWRHIDMLAVLPDEPDRQEWDPADDEAARDEQAMDRMLEPSLEGDLR